MVTTAWMQEVEQRRSGCRGAITEQPFQDAEQENLVTFSPVAIGSMPVATLAHPCASSMLVIKKGGL